MTMPPSGTVTFVFTDVEGSTRRWEHDPDSMRRSLAEHDAVLRDVFARHGGFVFATGGDGFAVAFQRAGDALAAAGELHTGHGLPVRVGIHTGEVEERDGNYFGPAVNRAARIMSAGHGGQVLVSGATAALAPRAQLTDLGEHRLRDLVSTERLFQLGGGTFPPVRCLDAYPGNLPTPATSFLGREVEIGEIALLIGPCRLVTLVGPGGVGKTRLALRAAGELLPRFTDGAWFVPLAGLAEPVLVPATIGATLGVTAPAGQSPSAAIASWLQRRSALVVIDNCEHLLDAVGELAGEVLAAGGSSVVLSTSRSPLGVPGEQVLPVEPFPDGSGLAVELFADRARSVRPGFAVTDANRAAVEEVCRRLDGLPLALELAAARIRGLAPADIAERLDQRFRLLALDRGVPDRHRTLEAVMRWSYDLLSSAEREVLDRFGVFAGSFDVAAAEAVAAGDQLEAWDVLEPLLQLVDRSLVVVEEAYGKTRYRLLETTRQFALARLAERTDTIRRRHLAHYRLVIERAGVALRGPEELAAHNELRQEQANLMTALRTSIDLDAPPAFERLLDRMCWWWHHRPHEAAPWYEIALATPAIDPALRVRTLAQAATNDMNLGLQSRAMERCTHAIALGREVQCSSALALGFAATIAFQQGDPDASASYVRRALTDADRCDDPFERAYALMMAASNASTLSLPEALDVARTALAAAHEVGSHFLQAHGLSNLGHCVEFDDPGRACDLYEQAHSLMKAADMLHAVHATAQRRAIVAYRFGELDVAAEWFALALRTSFERSPGMATQVLNAVVGSFRRTHPAEAARILGGLRRRRTDRKIPGSLGERQAEDRWRTEVHTALGASADDLFAEGEALDPASFEAWILSFLAKVAGDAAG